MRSKKYSLVALSIFLIFILFIASASAADVNETDVLSIDESTNIVNEKLALDSSLDNSASNDSNVLENNVNELLSVDNSGNNNVLKVSDNSLGDIPLCEGASIWYVDAAAGPGGNGTSKETAFQTLDDAVNNATDGDTIMVASGTYSDVHLNIGKYLNFEKYGDGEAIIDGSYITGIFTVTVTTININGLTFKNGNTADNGGAIYFENGIADSFINATFINNNAQSDGGAIYSFGEIVNSIINSTFIDNTAYDGGAIYFMGGAYNSTINSIFINNNATSGDGGAIVFKGGVNFTVEGEFINNTATKDGGAIYFDWDCLNVSVNATFINNTATNGGAIYGWYPIYNSTIGATFINNTANEDGGAIYFRDIINCTMSGKFVNNVGNNVIYILNGSNPGNEVHDSIFINNNVGNILNFNSGNVTVENNWFGNTAVNYSETPANVGIDLDNWLFLNATADSDVIEVNESSEITFILQSYKDSNVSDYDASKMNVWLDLTQTLGQLDKTTALIGDKITYTANEIGNSTVTGKFETASYDVSLKNIAPKIPTEIVLANETIDLKVGNISESMANLTPADAGNLTFNSSNESVVKVTVGGLIVAVGEGNATVTVSFAGNEVYAAAENKTIYVSVTLNDASVIVENDTLNLNIGDKFDLNATAVPDLEDIQYNSSDESVAVVDENGTVTAVSEGTAIITLTVGDGVMYALNSTNVTVTVTKFDAKINASADDIFEGEVANVIVLLPGDATGNVTVFLNGDSKVININDTTVRGLNGALSMLITYDNLTVGNYVVIAMYSGDDKYNPSNDFAMFEVLNPPKKNATVNVSADTVTEGENATVNVVLPSDAIGNVTVGNITVPVVNGTANVTISGLAVGNTTLPVTYSGDDNYNPAETNVTVTVLNKPKIDSNIDVSAEDIFEGEVANVIVVLPGSATGNVTIVLNGKSKVININNTTVRGLNGALSMLVSYDNLTVGNYVVLAMYSGDDKYNPSTDIVMFKVSEVPKENATMNVSADPIIEGENATVVVILPGDASGNVTVGNDTVGVVNGTAIFTIPGLTLGNYTFPVVYSGDDKYNPCEENVTVLVTDKIDFNISVSAQNITEGEVANVIVLLPGSATGNVTVILNNESKVININDSTVRGLNGVLSMLVTYDNLTVGNYTVVAVYSGDDRYNPSNATALFAVTESPKENATMNVSADPIIEGENATIVVILPEDASGNVTVGNDTVGVVNGTAIFTIPGLTLGNYTFPVVYSGDDKYNPCEENVTVLVTDKIDFNISVSAQNITEGEVANVIVLLPGSATGNVTVILNNESKVININDSTVRGLNGVLSMLVTYDNLTVGNYTVVAVYSGDDRYNPSNATASFAVAESSKENATMNVTVDSIVEGENATVTVTLPENATGNVTASVDGVNYTAPLENGTATIIIPDLAAGNYTVTVTYSGDDNYKPATKDVEITVDEDSSVVICAPDVVKYFKGPERFVVNVTDYEGNPLANKSVNITINGVTYSRTTDENGTASMALGLPSGEYNATVVVDNTTFISKITILTTVNGTDIVKVFRNGTQYYATFRDSEGNYLKDGTTVRFNINGVMYDRQVSGSEGLARLNINLEAGSYILTAINPENGEMSSNNITVISRLIENRDITKYYKNATQYTVKVIGDDGKAVGAGETVTFNINGVFYTRQTDESGIAKLNINLGPGNYTITAIYNDCMVSNNIEVLPVLFAWDLVKKYGTSDQFRALLLDGQGNPFYNQRLTFNINGVFYNRYTNSDGYAFLNIKLGAAVDQYVITTTYDGYSVSNVITIVP